MYDDENKNINDVNELDKDKTMENNETVGEINEAAAPQAGEVQQPEQQTVPDNPYSQQQTRYGVSYSPNREGYSNSPYGSYPQASQPVPSESAPKRKKKSGGTTVALIAIIAVAVILLSFAAGMGGAYLISNSDSTGNYKQSDSTDGDTAIKLPEDPSRNSGTVGTIGSVVINQSPSTETLSTSFTDVVANAEKCVVEINTEITQYSSWSGQYITQGAGSGVIFSRDSAKPNIYYIVTNYHVIDGAEKITIRLHNGEEYEGTLLPSDAMTDVALVSIEVVDGTELSVVTVMNQSVTLMNGQEVFAIGNPLGELGGSVTKGIISKTEREISVSGIKMNLMQIDAAVNPGNSGGGLFDMNGNLIGIVNAKYSDEEIEGLGFAIPITTVIDIIKELTENSYVTGRPGIGVGLVDKVYNSATTFSTVTYPTVTTGNSITGTYTNNGSTEVFTFSEGDVICGIDDTAVNSVASLLSFLMSNYEIGDSVKIEIQRPVIKTSGGRQYTTYESYEVTVSLVEYAPDLS